MVYAIKLMQQEQKENPPWISGYERRPYYRTGKVSLTEKEVNALLIKITVLEDDALIKLAISTGMRREDIVSIEIKNIDLHNDFGFIEFWERKKKRMWRVAVAGECLRVLKTQIYTLGKNEKWLFPSPRRNGGHLSGRHAYNILQKWLNAAGIEHKPFHALRSTCMKLASKRGYSTSQIMELTGDSWRTIEQHYLTPSESEMKELAQERPLIIQ